MCSTTRRRGLGSLVRSGQHSQIERTQNNPRARTVSVTLRPKPRPRPSIPATIPLYPFAARRGFTLIELLTVIAIIGILAAIIIPTVGKVRDTARQAVGLSNQRQIALAILAYAQDNNDRLPPRHLPRGYPQGDFRSVLSSYVTGTGEGTYASTTDIKIFIDPQARVSPVSKPLSALSHFGLHPVLFADLTSDPNGQKRMASFPNYNAWSWSRTSANTGPTVNLPPAFSTRPPSTPAATPAPATSHLATSRPTPMTALV